MQLRESQSASSFAPGKSVEVFARHPQGEPSDNRGIPTGLARVFLEGLSINPAGLALLIGDQSFTYAQLDVLARHWASRIIDASRRVPRRVGICAYRTSTTYIGTLAAVFSGSAFVPLNRKFPIDRTRSMIVRADLDAIFVDRQSFPTLADALSGMPHPPPIILTDGSREDAVCEVAFDARELATTEPIGSPYAVSPSDIAYLLFTSGSTGDPKGVPVTNGNVSAFLQFNRNRYGLLPTDRLSQTFDHTFDLSIFDMFMAWGAGAALCVPKIADLAFPASFIARNGVTVWFSVPSIGMRLLRQGELNPSSMPGLRWSLFCGEALPQKLAEAWQAAAPNSIVENLYGPTELTIACAAHRWDPQASPSACENGLVPLGKVFSTLKEVVVDERLDPVLPGQAGELCISGPQTFPGYWQAPDLTTKATFDAKNVDGTVVRYYRTGDIVRRNTDGEYVFLGRRDSQIKIKGHRIELGEVEAALRSFGCIDAVALAWPSREHAESIVAFVTGQVLPQSLGRQVRERLPRQMVPSIIEPLTAMPLNVNGKIDRLALHDFALTRFVAA